MFPETADFVNRIPGREGLNIRNPSQNLEVHSLIVPAVKGGVNSRRAPMSSLRPNETIEPAERRLEHVPIKKGQHRQRRTHIT